jgi:hypothetical protein
LFAKQYFIEAGDVVSTSLPFESLTPGAILPKLTAKVIAGIY